MKTIIGTFLVLAMVGAIVAAQAQPKPAPQNKATPSPVASSSLRISIPSKSPSACTAAPSDPAALAYVNHLKARLGKPVLLCGAKDGAAAALALASGEVDLAILQPADLATPTPKIRSILAPRVDPATGRVLSVVVSLAKSGIDSTAKLSGLRPIFIANLPASRDVPLRALEDHGVDTKAFGPELMATENTGFAALKEKKGDFLVLTAGARQRMCREVDPEKTACPEFVEIWRGRPTADKAFATQSNMSNADRYQLVGIHIALHIQNKAAFEFVSQQFPGATSLDPSEAGALSAGTR
jgi:ABC-type phosphate/phosphonate transport system substrate-binding protein